ncbi:MAG: S8 family serine peptidase [Ignavibacteria bacterium]|nr:S8 family serine peptidase [Ignavibacteria bacterium]
MKRFTICIIFIVFSFSLFANENISKLDAFSKKLLSNFQNIKQTDAVLVAKQIGYPFEVNMNQIFVTCLIEVSSSNNFTLENYKILSNGGNIFAVKVPLDKLPELISNESVSRISFGRKYKLTLDSARNNVRASFAHNGINLPRSFTGKGVIIGILDTGIDLLHPDFNNENGTRVLYLWDMSETVSPKPPDGFDWGREYTKKEIDNSLDSVLQKDIYGHGTHVAGIAGGNGKGKNEFKGIAPNADFVIVNGVKKNESGSFSDADILSACNYIFRKADELGKPCVINLSLGLVFGSHDGEGLLSKALSNLASEKKGRAIVASAGNEGEMFIHTGGEVKQGKRYELLLYPYNLCDYAPELCPDIPDYFLFGSDIWSDVGVFDSVYVGIYSPNSKKFLGEKGFSVKNVVDKAQIFDTNNTLVGLVSISNEIYNNSENILILISNEGISNLPIQDYIWSIVFVVKKDGKFDSWSSIPIESQQQLPARFPGFPPNNAMTVGSPADGKKIISVGAYVSKNKFTNILGQFEDWSQFYHLWELAGFSSRGPSRDGRILPIITAPGMLVFSALSSSTSPDYIDSSFIDPSGIYYGMSGTSMSAPIVAGAIALLFEQNPNLSVDEIINLLKLSARKDSYTGVVPNNNFGWGKLDVLRLLQLVTSVDEQLESSKFAITPNPATDWLLVTSSDPILEINVYDIFGNLILSTSNPMVQINNIASGVYLLNVKTLNKNYRAHFVKY